MNLSMKYPTTSIPLVLASLLASASLPAAVPLRWTVETSRTVPAQFEAFQGETLAFEAALQSYGKPLEAPANYSLYWQTNGMGNAWWSVPCIQTFEHSEHSNILFATWSPTNDVGARIYNCFIGKPGTIYHAAFQLRLRPSPGATPNVLPLPTPVIDFAKVTVLNPPWSGGGGGGVDTNAVRKLVDGSFTGGTNAVNASMSAISNKLDSESTIPGTPYKASLQWKNIGDGYELVINGVPFHVYGGLFKVDSLDSIIVGGIPLSSTMSWLLPVSPDRELYPNPMIFWSGSELNVNGSVSIYQGLSVAAPVMATSFDTDSWENYHANNEHLPAYLDSLAWRTTGNRTLAQYGITDGATKTELAGYLPLSGGTMSGIIRMGGNTFYTDGGNIAVGDGYLNVYGSGKAWFETAYSVLIGDNILPVYLSSGDWNTASDPFARVSQIPIISATNTTFSNAVLAVQIASLSTNITAEVYIAATNACANLGIDPSFIPQGGTLGTVGGLLVALAAAVTLLRKKTAHLESDGTADDDFAAHILGKQVANAKVRYALSTASSATMSDRTVNILTMTQSETLTFPTATTHDNKTYARDFILKLTYTAGTMELPQGVTKVGDELSFEAGKTYLIAFTEIAADKFYVRAIDITEAQA